ncbi:LysM peptidoglycan-binding domain-containing protein [Microbacterium dauci]|uniref:LysM peptidoglycan-binding domain-containing protein n=1 Tax=Microbacterium dauci TaxID=3048008 RepID=A0ABT6ZH30_9MICO|nr:LysM peptidoglycan-binding domain-containing protein [Microbacterium sp. LX3-4]MDJ1115291.1 LysM peptidoglycan-binding domain-containing protein [Microbacterium sp. LX3-4]
MNTPQRITVGVCAAVVVGLMGMALSPLVMVPTADTNATPAASAEPSPSTPAQDAGPADTEDAVTPRPTGPVPTGLDDAPIDYVVVEGDTAWGISQKFNIPIERIPNGLLRPGDVLDLTVDHSYGWPTS